MGTFQSTWDGYFKNMDQMTTKTCLVWRNLPNETPKVSWWDEGGRLTRHGKMGLMPSPSLAAEALKVGTTSFFLPSGSPEPRHAWHTVSAQ